MALWLVAFIGTRPFVAAGLGTIADLTTVDVAYAAASGVVLLLGAASLAGFPLRRREPRESSR